MKKWLRQILEILMAERAKDQKTKEYDLLDGLIKKHEELIPTVSKTQVMVDLYWKCYAYGDELKPHIEFLDGIMLSSTRDIAPSCVENVDELIERQEKSLQQLDAKRQVVTTLIEKGQLILANPDKPKFLERHVNQIQDGWEETKDKAKERLQLLQVRTILREKADFKRQIIIYRTPRRPGLVTRRIMRPSPLSLTRPRMRFRRSRRSSTSRRPLTISPRDRRSTVTPRPPLTACTRPSSTTWR